MLIREVRLDNTQTKGGIVVQMKSTLHIFKLLLGCRGAAVEHGTAGTCLLPNNFPHLWRSMQMYQIEGVTIIVPVYVDALVHKKQVQYAYVSVSA